MSGNWQLFGASKIGEFHIQENLPNQDSFKIFQDRKITVATVSDGLGSKKYSHLGSCNLTNEVVKLSKRFYGSKIRFEKMLFNRWKKSLKDISYKDALATLMLVIIKNQKIYIAKVGDGSVILLGKKNKILDESKSFGNVTIPFGYEKLEWFEFKESEIDFIFISTDGISDDIDKKIDFAKSFRNYFKNLPQYKQEKQAKNMLQSWRVKGSFDDKTFVSLIKCPVSLR